MRDNVSTLYVWRRIMGLQNIQRADLDWKSLTFSYTKTDANIRYHFNQCFLSGKGVHRFFETGSVQGSTMQAS